MTHTRTARPNAWVAVEDAPTLLSYSPVVNPAPLTTSVPKRAPTLGSLVVAITNNQGRDLQVTRVSFTVVVGKPGVEGAPLMSALPDSHGVSDEAAWELAGPPANFGEGKAEYTLTPKAGGTLKAGESVLVELSNFPTVEAPGSSIVAIEEVVESERDTSFLVPTFPSGFFFDNLVATVAEGSQHVPVAEVARGKQAVVLLWSTSVPVDRQTVRYSNPAEGQKVEQVKESGRWESPLLTADTVFSVAVEAPGDGGETLPAAHSVAVAVKDPALIAASLQAEEATVSGALGAGSLTVTGALKAEGGTTVEGQLSAAGATFSGTLAANNTVTILKPPEVYSPGKYAVPTDGFLILGQQQTFPLTAGGTLEVGSACGKFEWMPIGQGKLTAAADDSVPTVTIPAGPRFEEFLDLLGPFLIAPVLWEKKMEMVEALRGGSN